VSSDSSASSACSWERGPRPAQLEAQDQAAAKKSRAGNEAKVALQPLPDTPLPLKQVRAFENLRFRRPIVLTHANDGSQRVFVASQLGTIHVFPNDPNVKEDQVATFLDLEDKVMYKDKENEEGLLGFVFHPKFKENGQFFSVLHHSRHPARLGRLAVSHHERGSDEGRSGVRRGVDANSSAVLEP
jgi:hypothetical protein